MKAREVVEMLENLCPKHYALGWDNPGMHVGHWDNQVKKVLIAVVEEGADPVEYCKQAGLDKKVDSSAIEAIVDQAIAANPAAVEDYKNGKVTASVKQN